MNSASQNCYWKHVEVDPDFVGCRVLAQVRPGDPLREGMLLTVDMDQVPPVALVEDLNGQAWSVPGLHIWAEDEAPDA